MTIRVLLVDDQALIRTGFRLILASEPGIEVVGEAVDGRDAIDLARRVRPDVVLMDIRMPNMDGVEATRALAGAGVRDPVKVVILTTFDLDEYVVDALQAGACRIPAQGHAAGGAGARHPCRRERRRPAGALGHAATPGPVRVAAAPDPGGRRPDLPSSPNASWRFSGSSPAG